VSIVSLDNYLKTFYATEKKFLQDNYPGLTIHRLRQDIILHAFLNGIDSEELFDYPYLPSRTNPLTIFFEKLNEGVPLEYITGYAYFFRSLFKVTKDVLIPRSETEIMVELAAQEIKKNYKSKHCRIADVGTGSGAIAISLLMDDSAQIEMIASDISEEALKLAQENFFTHQYAVTRNHKLTFLKSDRLNSVAGSFDIIISNPPYIKKRADKSDVHFQVLNHEPHLALFLEDEEYDNWFKEFFISIYEKLSDQGVSFIEGHENHLIHLKSIALLVGFKEVIVIPDYSLKNRFLKLKK
jgi:release factor glutamine methyltransferase